MKRKQIFSSVKIVWRIATTEWKNLVRSSKMLVLAVFLIFINIQIISTLKGCAALMRMKVAFLEPFAALSNSGAVVLIMPLLFLVMMAEFPEKGGISPFIHIRCTRRLWTAGQILFVFMSSVSLIFVTLLFSALFLFPDGKWSMEFSDAVTKYVAAFPERSMDYVTELLPANLYNQMTLRTAIMHSSLLLTLYFLFLGLVLLFFSLYGQKIFGVVTDAAVILLGTVSCALRLDIMWCFPMAHTITWLHFEEYFSEQIFPMEGSYLYFGVWIVLLVCGCMFVAKRYESFN